MPKELTFTSDQVPSLPACILQLLHLQLSISRLLSVYKPFVAEKIAMAASADSYGEKGPRVHEPEQMSLPKDEKSAAHLETLETLDTEHNLVYNDVDEEPEIHARTWIALAAMFLLNLVQVVALQGPPAVVSNLSLLYLVQKADRGRYSAFLYWKGPQQQRSADLGTQFALTRPSSPWPRYFLRLRYFPSPKTYPCWVVDYLAYRCSHCTRFW